MQMNTDFSFAAVFVQLVNVLLLAGLVWLIVLVIRALRKYLRSGEKRREAAVIRQTLGERIKACRTEKRMTQEFVAESLGVSRQAVSKWESGQSDPSTQNLIALAKLFGISPEEFLRDIEPKA